MQANSDQFKLKGQKTITRSAYTLAKKADRFYKGPMTTVKEIEQAVEHLPPNDLKQFRDWFEAFQAARWDKELEDDVSSGKLDFLINEAQSEYKSGKTSEL